MAEFCIIPAIYITAIIEELTKSGRLAGSISGGRKDKAQFIPDIYTQSQNEWVDNFYKQNGYLGKYDFSFTPNVFYSQLRSKFN